MPIPNSQDALKKIVERREALRSQLVALQQELEDKISAKIKKYIQDSLYPPYTFDILMDIPPEISQIFNIKIHFADELENRCMQAEWFASIKWTQDDIARIKFQIKIEVLDL